MERKTVCIFCASSDGTPAVYREAATQVGALCARAGVTMINGGGKVGLMGLCSDACLENGGRVTGIIRDFMVTEGWGHEGLSRVSVRAELGSRREQLRDLAGGFLDLPG